jgi:hypothetical protein
METSKKYNNYPFWIVVVANVNSLFLYFLGSYIMFQSGLIYGWLYLAFVLFMEIRLISQHCINCYYFGKRCGFARGNLSALFFKKGDPSFFCKKEMTWNEMIPDLLISLIPFLTGIVLIILKFNFIILVALILIVALSTLGNGYVRGNLTCKYCKQKELGCPADALFNKK